MTVAAELPAAPAIARHPVPAPVRPEPSIAQRVTAEALGTFLLVLLGVGAVHAAVLTGAQVGVWQVAVVWAIGVALAIHLTGAISGAHVNPAITLASAAWAGFPWRRVPAYLLAQLAGAAAAGAALHALFAPFLATFERTHGLTRGGPGSERAAMVFGEYFPNPALDPALLAAVDYGIGPAFAAECLGTAVLALVVFSVTARRNALAPEPRQAPLLIGLTVAALISVLAPLTQGCFNPARDLGPRLVARAIGFADVAWSGPAGGTLIVYVAAPFAGALLGGAVFRAFLLPAYLRASSPEEP